MESRAEIQEVDKFHYLGVMITMDGGMREEVDYRVLEGRKVWGRWESCGKSEKCEGGRCSQSSRPRARSRTTTNFAVLGNQLEKVGFHGAAEKTVITYIINTNKATKQYF